MTTMMFLILVQIFIILFLSEVSTHKCLEDSNNFYCNLGTKTPYRFIANYNDSELNYPGCIEKKIWLMIRHGTRYPGKKDFKLMTTNLPVLQKKIIQNFKSKNSELSADVIERLSHWELSFDDSYTMNLAHEGENELIDLAERMQARFPNLLLEDYDENIYKFKYTATQRTETSAKSFLLGLFGQYHSENISFSEPEHRDPILRFYKKCERWRTEVDKNPETFKEKEIFMQGEIFQRVLLDISKRIGFAVDYDTVKIIYAICGFETAWDETIKSPWCDLLSRNDVKVLQFIEDLEYYWFDGYGYKINYEQACPALRDMFTFFESPDEPSVTAYFTHSGSILKMLSILGIAKDEVPLTHASFALHGDSRKWKLSQIDAFASNIAFILYECEKQERSILFLHQERVVHIPNCPPGPLCPMSTMKRIFPDTEQECQFDTMCSIQPK